MKRLVISSLFLLVTATVPVVLAAAPAFAWQVHISITGAGQVTETTAANLVGSGCVTSAANPTGVVGKDCYAGTPTGDYGSAWTVRYVATPKPGYRFVHWQSDGSSNPVLCDGANGSSTYTGSACQFSTFNNLQVRAVFEDVTAPTMSSLTGPHATVNGPATFTFAAASDPTVTGFECRVAGVHDWTSCSSGRTESPASSGGYTFEVRAVDASENRSAVSSWAWTVDKAAPETTITAAPNALVNSTSASFEYSSNEAGTFQCALDAAVLAACQSPTTLTALAQGQHVFSVQAVDGAGNVDLSPATRAWTVDTVAPATHLIRTPAARSRGSATFEFGSGEPGTFSCNLDGTLSPCTSPVTYAGLAHGGHTFSVTATDSAGNADATPATHTWTVDIVAPRVVTVAPTGSRVAPRANLTAVFSEAMREATVEAARRGVPTTFTLRLGARSVPATVTYRLSGGRGIAVLNPTRALAAGRQYTATVRAAARDLAGNALVTRSWNIRIAR